MFRQPVTLGTLRLPNLPSVSLGHDRALEIFRRRGVDDTDARGVQGLQGGYPVQRLSRGIYGEIPCSRVEMFKLWQL